MPNIGPASHVGTDSVNLAEMSFGYALHAEEFLVQLSVGSEEVLQYSEDEE